MIFGLKLDLLRSSRGSNFFPVLVILFCVVTFCTSLPQTVNLGGLFDSGDEAVAIAFHNAIERINANKSVTGDSKLRNLSFNVPRHDSFTASKKVCEMVQRSVAGIFGPRSGTSASHVQSMCDALGIPHVEIRWDHRETRDELSVNLYPHPESLGKAFRDVLETLRWHRFTILYSDNEGLFRLQEILKIRPPPDKELKLTIRQLIPDEDNRPLLKALKKAGETHIVLDCPVEKIYSILEQALQVGMLTEYHNYFITSLDFHAVETRLFKDSGTNITGLSIVDIESNEYSEVIGRDWGESRSGAFPFADDNNDFVHFSKAAEANYDAFIQEARIAPRTLMTRPALMYDAVTLYALALFKLNSESPEGVSLGPLDCSQNQAWEEGRNLIWFMKMMTFDGITGPIRLDAQGYRKEFGLDILELGKKGLEKVGRWERNRGANYSRLWTDREAEYRQELKDKNLIVTVPITPPYVMWKENKDDLVGNDKFEGFCIDLIHEISNILQFNYTFRLVKDGKYGSRDKETGEWNGMIRELLDREADLATADLTISYEREEAVDFTMPFMNLGIGILYKKPAKKAPNLFSFLSPLSLDVWIYMATAYLGVSVMLFVIARFTPYEWDNPHPCVQNPPALENQFSLLNSLWFTIGSLMQQGSDVAPKAVSTRMVAGMWWFFTLIMISSYTANLAAFLTVERMESAIQSAEDLAKQTKIKYGSMGSGSTKAFFRDSKIETYQRMWNFMDSSRPTVFTKSNQEGVERVKAGGYAFLMESTSIEYVIEKHCELMQVGGLLDNKGYGIALPPGSPYTSAISSAILQLQEKGWFLQLKTKWWKEKNEGAGNCDTEASKASSSAASELGLANVGGVFVVLMGGMGVAVLIALCEFVWKSRKLAMEENESLFEEMGKELKFAFRCRGSTKPIPKHQTLKLSSSQANLSRQQSQKQKQQRQAALSRQATVEDDDEDDDLIDEELRLSSPPPPSHALAEEAARAMLPPPPPPPAAGFYLGGGSSRSPMGIMMRPTTFAGVRREFIS